MAGVQKLPEGMKAETEEEAKSRELWCSRLWSSAARYTLQIAPCKYSASKIDLTSRDAAREYLGRRQRLAAAQVPPLMATRSSVGSPRADLNFLAICLRRAHATSFSFAFITCPSEDMPARKDTKTEGWESNGWLHASATPRGPPRQP